MITQLGENDFSSYKKNVVLLFNFGGPESKEEVEPFLRRLFEDPFIIRSPFMLPSLRRFLAKRISQKRRDEAIEQYSKIDFSPINRFTKYQADHLETVLKKKYENTKVIMVNRYTKPFAEDVIPTLDLKNSRNFFLSLYPHLCHSTTVSSFHEFDKKYKEKYGKIDFAANRIFSWWNNSDYMDWTLGSIQRKISKIHEKNPQEKISIVFSAHGLPEKYYLRGDPYIEEVSSHFYELANKIKQQAAKKGENSSDLLWYLSFQSRVGPVAWTKPYTDDLIEEIAEKNKGTLLMVPVSFTSDHIETLYEMDVTYKELALSKGFESYERIELPNTNDKFTKCLASVLESHGF